MAYCIYIAGALDADSAMGYIKNLSRMADHALLVMEAGYAVFVPGIDFLLLYKAKNPNYNMVFYNSWWWIKKADGVYVCPKSSKSKGTKREIRLAKKRGIPIFYSIADMNEYFFVNGEKKVKKIKKKKVK